MHPQGIKISRGRLIRGTGFQNVPLLLFVLLQLFAECSQRNDQVPQNMQKGGVFFLVTLEFKLQVAKQRLQEGYWSLNGLPHFANSNRSCQRNTKHIPRS